MAIGDVIAIGILAATAGGSVTFVARYFYLIGELRQQNAADCWAVHCIDAQNPRAWRALAIDHNGIHLRKLSGRTLSSWPWPTIRRARTGTVRAIGAKLVHEGLQLELTDTTTIGILIPSPSSTRYSRNFSPAHSHRSSGTCPDHRDWPAARPTTTTFWNELWNGF